MKTPTFCLEAIYGLQVWGGEPRELRGPTEVRRWSAELKLRWLKLQDRILGRRKPHKKKTSRSPHKGFLESFLCVRLHNPIL